MTEERLSALSLLMMAHSFTGIGFKDDVNKLIVDYLSERGTKVEIQKTRVIQ